MTKLKVLPLFGVVFFFIFLLILSCESGSRYEVYYVNRLVNEIEKKKTILIFPFKNTGLSKFSYYSEGITESVINDLNLVKGINVISQEDRKKALKELAFKQAIGLEDKEISKIANITGADIFLTGSYLVEQDQIRIIARLIDSTSGTTIKSIKIDGPTKDIFSLQDSLALNLLDTMVGNISSEEKSFIKNKPSYSEKAFELFAKGLEIEDSNPKSALEYYKNAIKIQSDYVDALSKSGNVSLFLNEISESIKYFEKAITLKEKIGLKNTPDFAYTLLRLGNAYKMKGDYSSSLDYYKKTQNLMEKLGIENSPGYASTLQNIGNVYKENLESDKALSYYKKTLDLRDKLNLQNTSNYATTLNNIGFVHSLNGKLDIALDYYIKSGNLRENLGLSNSSGYATTMNNIGSIFNIKKEYDKAIDYYNKSKQIREKLNQQNSLEYATILNNISISYDNKGESKKAIEFLEKANSIKSKYSNIGEKGNME